ncbi:hypothetical protein Ndes2526B_g01437 [Nannochloris sp. 'desiccata']
MQEPAPNFSMQSRLYVCALALLLLPMAIMGRPTVDTKDTSDKDPIGPLISLPTSPVNGTRGLGANDCGGRGCNYYANKTVRGNGIKRFKTSSQITCCNKCFSSSSCYAWSWGFRGNSSRKRMCYFFSYDQYDSSGLLYTQYYNSGFGFCNGQ